VTTELLCGCVACRAAPAGKLNFAIQLSKVGTGKLNGWPLEWLARKVEWLAIEYRVAKTHKIPSVPDPFPQKSH